MLHAPVEYSEGSRGPVPVHNRCGLFVQEHFFDCWQNPLEWGPKQGKGRAGRRVGQKSRTPGVRRAAVRWAGGSDCRLEHIRDLRKTARSPRVLCHLEDGIEYGA